MKINYFKKLLQYKTFWILIAICLRHYSDYIWKSDLAECSITSIEKTLRRNTTVNIAKQIVGKNPSQNVFFKRKSHVTHLFRHPKKNYGGGSILSHNAPGMFVKDYFFNKPRCSIKLQINVINFYSDFTKRRPYIAKVTEKRAIVLTVYILHVFQNILPVKERKNT